MAVCLAPPRRHSAEEVEDEPKMADLLRRGLIEDGYAVDVAADGSSGYQAAMVLDEAAAW